MKSTVNICMCSIILLACVACSQGAGTTAGQNSPIDTEPPAITSTQPVNGASEVAVSDPITVTFSEKIDVKSVTTEAPATFSVSDNGIDVEGTITCSDITCNFMPISNLAYGKTYTATVSNRVKDVVGNSLVSDYSWNFTTSSLDLGFGTGGKVITTVGNPGNSSFGHAVAIQSDGKIVVAGRYDYYNDNPIASTFALARYNVDGTLDSSFGSSGVVISIFDSFFNGVATAVTIQNDGKIVVAGYKINNDVSCFVLARYNSNGSLDASFGLSGTVTTSINAANNLDYAYALAIQPDGNILVAGESGIVGNIKRYIAVVRYNPNGTLDSTFGSKGIVLTDLGSNRSVARELCIQSDEKIVVAGTNDYDFSLVRYNANGTLDSSFASGGIATAVVGTGRSEIKALQIQSDGKLVAVGHAYNSKFVFGIARFNIDGTLDNSFGSGGTTTTSITSGTDGTGDYAQDISIQSDGKIVVAGNSDVGTEKVFSMVRYNANGSLDTSFALEGKITTHVGGTSSGASTVSIQPDGKIILAGYTSLPAGDTYKSYYAFAMVRYWP